MQNCGDVGDKGVLAVPVEYGDDGGVAGLPRIDWAAIEAANEGVHLPDVTDEHYNRRILFSRVRASRVFSVVLVCAFRTGRGGVVNSLFVLCEMCPEYSISGLGAFEFVLSFLRVFAKIVL